jgi:hypothetical protein
MVHHEQRLAGVRRLRLAGVLAAGVFALLAAGCATSPAQMTPKQKEAAEVRAYCLKNPDDIVTCLGFLGDH